MSAKFGWRIHFDTAPDEYAASLWTAEAGDLVTVRGFLSRAEAFHFTALYLALMANAREDEATKLLREFTSRGAAS